ncbi:hypothetical protein MMC14_000491 [Varicellaria rhodocarpa]|nr:hypothetical protein [Varicellaria rhodocarpa]
MYPTFLLLSLVAIVVPSCATPFPTEVTRAVASQCGQWDSIQTGTYTLYQDLWNEATGTGSQCSQVNSLSGSSLAWSSTWSWSGGSDQVKTYANAVVSLKSKPLSQYKTIPTTWNWSYSGSNIVADVSYDSFLGTSATASASYEVMIWLGALGGAGPISSTGNPIATPTVGSTTFNLYSGPNGAMTVYSFVAINKGTTSFTGDLLSFYTYLETHFKVPSTMYLQSIGAGTEPFTGSGAKFTTSKYSITVSQGQ